MSSTAVILMAYGSPDRLADVPAYYADIRGGRPVAPEHLDELVARYRRLGVGDGSEPSPLNAITEQTRAALERSLGLAVYTGMRHWQPRIADAVDQALGDGAELLIGLVLAPHWSTMSVARYQDLFDAAVAGRVETRFVERWGSEPGFVAFLAERIQGADAHVIFTAHSLPERIREAADPYEDELLETSRQVADAAHVGDWSFAFQSASPTGEPWLGPDIVDHLEQLQAEGVRRVLVCPVGFVSDHLEIRWDLDVEAAGRARELGLELDRIEMPNADAAFVDVLAAVVRRHAPLPSAA
jgi:protoporphyrin/coproporphyrin ferrochelatase